MRKGIVFDRSEIESFIIEKALEISDAIDMSLLKVVIDLDPRGCLSATVSYSDGTSDLILNEKE